MPEFFQYKKSILVKSVLFFTVVIILSLFCIGYLINKKATNTVRLYNQDKLSHASNIIKKQFYSMLSEVENDISLISKNIDVSYLKSATEWNNIPQLELLFSTFLTEKPNYFQIRLLDVEENGKEFIKFIKKQESIQKIPFSELQFKGNKVYYKKALQTSDKFYFSEITLNEEYGKLSDPYTPTLRAIGKLYDAENNLQYLIIINVDLSNFYDEISQLNQSEIKNVIVSNDGEYKFHQQLAYCFGNQTQSENYFQSDYQASLDILFQSNETIKFIEDVQGNSHILKVTPLFYSSQLNKLYLVTIASEKSIFANIYNINNYSLSLIALICFILLLSIFFYTYYFVKKIKRITQEINDYNTLNTERSYLNEIKYRGDEIGVLANTFLRMKHDIDANVSKLESSLLRERKAVKEKNEFLQNMSHELRTPLNAILGLTSLLNKNKPTAKQKPIINALERSGKNLNGLMHDILEEQQILQGKITLNPVKTDLNLLLKTIVSNYKFEAIKKGLELQLNVSENLEDKYFLIDPLRFEQVLTNLLINAIKYTNQGQIVIDVTMHSSRLSLSVSDTGSGISPANLNKIKERFFRVPNASGEKVSGFGLGLSIVKKIIDLFEGTLEVQSAPEKGSIFSFIIPIKQVAPEPNSKRIKDVEYPSKVTSLHVLHIEDDISSQVMLKSFLSEYKIHIEQCQNIAEANRKLQNNCFNVIITDLMLDTSNILDHVKNELTRYGIPIIIFSALEYNQENDTRLVHIKKPESLDNILDALVVSTLKDFYDTPNLEKVYDLYDHNAEKIKNYLKILYKEFLIYYQRIKDVSIEKDAREWNAIKHKILNHINTLDLTKTKDVFENSIVDINAEELTFLRDNILFILCFLRTTINSKD